MDQPSRSSQPHQIKFIIHKYKQPRSRKRPNKMNKSERKDFTTDTEKMNDFGTMSKTEFLASYSYISEAEYDTTDLLTKLRKLNQWKLEDEILVKLAHHKDTGILGNKTMDALDGKKYGFNDQGKKYYTFEDAEDMILWLHDQRLRNSYIVSEYMGAIEDREPGADEWGNAEEICPPRIGQDQSIWGAVDYKGVTYPTRTISCYEEKKGNEDIVITVGVEELNTDGDYEKWANDDLNSIDQEIMCYIPREILENGTDEEFLNAVYEASGILYTLFPPLQKENQIFIIDPKMLKEQWLEYIEIEDADALSDIDFMRISEEQGTANLTAQNLIDIMKGGYIFDWTETSVARIISVSSNTTAPEAKTNQDKALELINNIDWDKLKKQKTLIYTLPISDEREGLLALLDSFQDFAVDVLGMHENVVFNFTEDE